MKKLTSRELAILTAMGLLALPVSANALTVRTEHRSGSGGVTVTEGAATATGDQSSSVSVQNVISGTTGRVQVTTTKDGVTTTETRDLNGNGSVQVVTPPPPSSNDDSGRTPRDDRGNRGVVAVQSNNTVSVSTGPSNSSVRTSVQASGGTSKTTVKTTAIPSAKLAIASMHADLGTAVIVPKLREFNAHSSTDVSSAIDRFLNRIFSLFGLNA